ncbi:hypothetical protein AAC387_Pa08g0355 [Persea americana]
MGLRGCSINGVLDTSKFSEPMPWIGLYVALGSLLCFLAMAADAYSGIRRGKLWFPCRYFSINAASLTLLSIITKLPADLNTSMPSRQDQLTKLSSTVLLCTVMSNFMPSLGKMEDSELLTNIVALAILVVTITVNVGIQMGTGVIYAFIPEHAVIMLFMLLLLVLLAFSALTVPTTKKILQHGYKLKYQQASGGRCYEAVKADRFSVTKLKEDVKKYWMMAHTSGPQYVQARSVTGTASGVLCILSSLILVEAAVRSLTKGSMNFCSGESDYKWSSALILVSQGLAVAAGTIAPAFRWFHSVGMRCHMIGKGCCRDELKVEWYWVKRLEGWKESLLPFSISTRTCRKVVHVSRHWILDFLIGIQSAVVITSKFIRLASLLILCLFSKMLPSFNCAKLRRKLRPIGSSSGGPGMESMPLNLCDFVLHLDGEEGVVQMIMRKGCEATEKWIHKGTKKQPTHLIDLLTKSTRSQGYKGVGEFDSDNVPSIISEKPPNCWSLAVATLTSIAFALPNVDRKMIKSLLCSVNEGLRYARIIEQNLDRKELTNTRAAADIVWVCVDLHDRWLDEDLHKLAFGEESAKTVIEKLAAIGKKCVLDFATTRHGKEKRPQDWPPKILAANSMYRIGKTILQDYNDKLGMDGTLFEWLQTTIADLLAACLTNLPHMIHMECICSSIEVRELRVRKAAYLVGEVENILMTLGQQAFPDMDPDRTAFVDEWRLSKQKDAAGPFTAPL